MVEKIIINPTKVRGYGNIMNQHSTTDYTNYACTLTEETDTVNGAETTVNKITDTIQFFDTCTNGTSKWSGADSRVTATSDSTGITVTWVSGTYIFWANADGSTEFDYTGDFTVEFDLLSNGNNATIQIYDGSASTYYNKTLDQLSSMNAGHYKIVKDGQVFRTYVDGVEKTTQQVNSNITNACRVGFRQRSASTIKFKNFKIYG